MKGTVARSYPINEFTTEFRNVQATPVPSASLLTDGEHPGRFMGPTMQRDGVHACSEPRGIETAIPVRTDLPAWGAPTLDAAFTPL